VAFASLGASALAQMPTLAVSGYVVSADGQEVTDARTGLVWRRCAEGARWDGNNCSGIADTYNHGDALGRARRAIGYDTTPAAPQNTGPAEIRSGSAPVSSTAWRLPTVYELSSITDRNRSNPTIDTVTFPNTPASWHWTSTFDTTNPSYIWIISFYNGYASNIGPYNKGYVRLVRGAALSAAPAQ
jgi:Protein of unknown function (DUF1566)